MTYYREERRPAADVENLFECHEQDQMGCDTVARPHVHEYFEALYCQQGSYELSVGGEVHFFAQGDMVFIDPNEVHHTRSLDPGLNRYIVLKFVPDALLFADHPIYEMKGILPYLWMGAAHRKLFHRQELEQGGIGALMEDILMEYTARRFGYEMAIRADLCRLFLWILRCAHQESGETTAFRNVDSEILLKLQQAFTFVEENFTQELSMEDAAAHCGMKYTAFSRFFARYAQKSFPEYLTEVRLKKAAILLATTRESITDIALSVGFSTTSYFIQRFRLHYGASPGHFRRQFTGEAPGAVKQTIKTAHVNDE